MAVSHLKARGRLGMRQRKPKTEIETREGVRKENCNISFRPFFLFP